MNLRNVPIKRKLVYVIMLTSTVVLLLTSGTLITYELFTFHRTILQNAATIAQIIAANSTSALSFDNEKVGAEILSKLEAEPSIVMACLYKKDGSKLARYPSEQPRSDFPAKPGTEGHRFEKNALQIFLPVREGDAWQGTLFLKLDLTPMYSRVVLYGGIVGGVMIGALLIALALSNWLQKGISEPILELAETAKSVSVNKNYLVRARKYGTDELGSFTDSFNHMLMQIHDRDAALRQSEERLRLTLEASETGTWDWDVQTGFLEWDDFLYKLFGRKRGDFDGRFETFLGYLHPEDRAAVSRLANRALAEKTDFVAEYRVLWPDKSYHYLASRGNALYDERGKAVRLLGVTLDVTEAKEAAEGLSLLAAIVSSSDDAIVGKDLFGTIVSWNVGAERMFGYTAEEAIGSKSTLIVPQDRYDEEVQALQRVQQGKIEHFETRRVRKDGSFFFVSITFSPIRNAEGATIGVSANSRDISDRIRAEEEIRTLNAELEERVIQRTAELAATNQELEAFTYSVSHDLRAPLRHIDAFAQLLEDELKETISSGNRRYIERIRRGVQNMGQLVDDLLNLSRVGRVEIARDETDLNSVVEEVVADLKPEYESREINWSIEALPSLKCDPGLIKQVFINLLSNAVKYTRTRPKAVIEIGQKRVGRELAIFIRDNGVGFNMKYADKLFGVFQRLHRAEDFEGTGVGLATVQRIIQLHEGRIWVEAELDKGATFYFTLKGMHPL
ncbi:MAG: PAS domain S-box protein [Verrucomicrobiota bacterium]